MTEPMPYRVSGIPFTDAATAHAYAQFQADTYGRPIHVMEKVDDLTPWHVLSTANPDTPADGFTAGRLT